MAKRKQSRGKKPSRKSAVSRRASSKRRVRKNVAPVTPAMLEQYASLFPGGQVTPAILKRVGKEYARVANPGEGNFRLPQHNRQSAFERCVRAVAARGGARDPRGVCAAAGRKKYGANKFAAMAAAGRKRKNPRRGKKYAKKQNKLWKKELASGRVGTGAGRRYDDQGRRLVNPRKRKRKNPIETAADTYRKFHGREAEEIIEVKETLEEHSVLSGIGELVSLTVASVDGRSTIDINGFKGALLAQNEEATQLFIVGGDQSVDVREFGIVGRPHENEVLGAATEVAYKTRKDHLGKGGGAGERVIHVHDFGSLRQVDPADPRRRHGSRLPVVMYDTRNAKLMFAGGGYDLPEVGIRG